MDYSLNGKDNTLDAMYVYCKPFLDAAVLWQEEEGRGIWFYSTTKKEG
jgi:hypothetical protein